MRIAIEGCTHGELEKTYETIKEIEEKDGRKVNPSCTKSISEMLSRCHCQWLLLLPLSLSLLLSLSTVVAIWFGLGGLAALLRRLPVDA